MNQDQRKFLIEQVENTCKNQIEELEKQIPDKPSLNNYLIAAFLDNSIKFADIEQLKIKMRNAVLKYGSSECLVCTENERSWRYNKRNRDDDKQVVQVDPEDLFIIPQNYKDSLAEYEAKKQSLEKEIEKLENIKKTIILKLQIGSAATLDKLVMQVDNMGDLSMVNTQLLIGQDKPHE